MVTLYYERSDTVRAIHPLLQTQIHIRALVNTGKLETAPLALVVTTLAMVDGLQFISQTQDTRLHESHQICLKTIIPGGQLWLVA